MSTTGPVKETVSDEIDLRDLCRRMSQTMSDWCRKTGRAFLITVIFLLKNILLLTFSILAGVGISFALKWTTKPEFISEITLRSNAVPTADMISNINQLDILIREKNYSSIASALSSSPEEVVKIKRIKALWVIDKNRDNIPDFTDYRDSHNVYDSVNVRMTDRFVVQVKVENSDEISKMRDRLFSYVNKNPVFIRHNEFRLKTIDELLLRINYDIEQLDSLQKVKYFEETRNIKPEKGGQIIFLQDHSTQLVYDDIYTLYLRKQSLDEEKSLNNQILSVINDFYQPLRRHNGGWYYGKTVIPACLFLTLLFLIIKRNRARLKEIFSKY
ncbi:MAG TPA: hypothetical protein PLO24_01570 [Bacteroidales bacterium]|jgi:hypothetical protein|nr:hypothetical protein [Bacteroidales bacterium]HOS72990.1 hypothetical protein [Bacteroidales bacterium]HQH23407.1 hypothetical protein [Bacteroidales bacterium]HQJ81348.1 hypothetical protein [Bacteroidales bacterium]